MKTLTARFNQYGMLPAHVAEMNYGPTLSALNVGALVYKEEQAILIKSLIAKGIKGKELFERVGGNIAIFLMTLSARLMAATTKQEISEILAEYYEMMEVQSPGFIKLKFPTKYALAKALQATMCWVGILKTVVIDLNRAACQNGDTRSTIAEGTTLYASQFLIGRTTNTLKCPAIGMSAMPSERDLESVPEKGVGSLYGKIYFVTGNPWFNIIKGAPERENFGKRK
jgi:hypothetical protein